MVRFTCTLLLFLSPLVQMYGQRINLQTQVQGVLPVANGGTGGPAFPECDANVREFGATGDGVTDETAAFAAAIAAAADQDSLCVPAGSYLVDGIDFGEKSIRLRGAGVNLSTLNRSATAGGPLINSLPTAVNGNVEISGFSLRMIDSPADTTAIRVDDCSQCIINNLFITYVGNASPGVALHLSKFGSSWVRDIRIIDARKGVDYQGDVRMVTFFKDFSISSTAALMEYCFELERTDNLDTGGVWLINFHCGGDFEEGIYLHSSAPTPSALYAFIFGSSIDFARVGHGIHLENVRRVHVEDTWSIAGLPGSGNAIHLDAADANMFAGNQLRGTTVGVSFSNAPDDNVFLSNYCFMSQTRCYNVPATNPPTNLTITGNVNENGMSFVDDVGRLETASHPSSHGPTNINGNFVVQTSLGSRTIGVGTSNIQSVTNINGANSTGFQDLVIKSRSLASLNNGDVIRDIRGQGYNSTPAVFDSFGAVRIIASTVTAGSEVGTVDTLTAVGGALAVTLRVNDAPQWLDRGTKPTCDSVQRGKVWYDAGAAGVLDTFEICRKDAGDAYAWVTLF